MPSVTTKTVYFSK